MGLLLAGGRGRRYVVDVDVDARRVVVGSDADLLVGSVGLHDVVVPGGDVRGVVLAQWSAHGSPRAATFDGATLTWVEPQRRIAPGQSVVLYRGDRVVAGGLAD
jgi:tRNA-specific 2-thiouridylase